MNLSFYESQYQYKAKQQAERLVSYSQSGLQGPSHCPDPSPALWVIAACPAAVAASLERFRSASKSK